MEALNLAAGLGVVGPGVGAPDPDALQFRVEQALALA